MHIHCWQLGLLSTHQHAGPEPGRLTSSSNDKAAVEMEDIDCKLCA